MNNDHCGIFADRKENQAELKDLVLKGNCPYCNSQKVTYREYVPHQQFGFNCHKCKWKGKYQRKDFEELAQNYHHISSS